MNSDDVIDKLIDRYRSCSSYSDSGVVRHSENPDRDIEFETKFKRPDWFLFKWRGVHKGDGLIWNNEQGAFERYEFDGGIVNKCHSLDVAVAGAKHGSSGTANIIHSLLLPALEPNLLSQLTDVVLDVGIVSGKRAYHLMGDRSSNRALEAWIDCDDFVLLQTREHVTMTAEFKRSAIESVKSRDPDIYRRLAHTADAEEDSHHWEERTYLDVSFEPPIDNDVFHPFNDLDYSEVGNRGVDS